MKKTIVTLAASLLAVSGFAQGFYLRAGLGYAFPQAGQSLDGTGTPYSGSVSSTTYVTTYNGLKSASFSAGFQGGLGLGYMFNEHVGVQLDAEVGLAAKKYTFVEENGAATGGAGTVSYVQQAKSPFLAIPALVLQTGGDPWNIYARLGVVVPVNTKITEDQIVTYPATAAAGLEVDDYTVKVKNSFSLGYSAAAGLQYKLNDKVSVWGEVSILSLSAYIKEADLTSVTSNGQGVPLSQISGAQTIKYSKNAAVDSNGSVQPTYSQPFSNVGINVGICFKLGESKHPSHHGSRKNDDDLIDNSKPYRRR